MDAMEVHGGTGSAQDEAAISVSGMDCASCVTHVERAAKSVEGVRDARVNLARGRAVVSFDPDRTDPKHIADAITQSGYVSAPESLHVDARNAEDQRLHHQAEHASAWLRRAIVAII